MLIESFKASNQGDLAVAQSAISEREPEYPQRGGFTGRQRFPAVPRFAPEGSITMATAVHLLGRALYGSNWTGEEVGAGCRPEPSDEELATRAFITATDEAIAPAGAELPFRTEADILQDLCEKRDIEFAPRRRCQWVAERLIALLYRGALKAMALSPDEGEIAVPSRIWAATSVMRLFHNGGYLEIRGGMFRIPEEARRDEHAVVIMNQKQLEDFISDPARMDAVRPEPDTPQAEPADPYRTGLPGRPTAGHLVLAEFYNRAKRGVVKPKLKPEAEALVHWLKENYPDAPNVTPRTVESKIRMAYWQFQDSLEKIVEH